MQLQDAVKELRKVKQDNKLLKSKILALEKTLEKNNFDLNKETKTTMNMRQIFNEKVSDFGGRVIELMSKSVECDLYMKDLEKKTDKYIDELANMLDNFSLQNRVLDRQLQKLKEENDILLGKSLKTSGELQLESTQLPTTVQELRASCMELGQTLTIVIMARERLEQRILERHRT